MWSGYFTKDGIKTGFERHKCTGNTGMFDTGWDPVGINAAVQKTVEWNEPKFLQHTRLSGKHNTTERGLIK